MQRGADGKKVGCFELLRNVRVVIGLGAIGFNAILKLLASHGVAVSPRPQFGHNAVYQIGKYTVIGTYHPSRQNTNTGKLTRTMFAEVLATARRLAPRARG